MGSSIAPHLHIHWVLIAIVCGVFYLIFDALRSFALQLSPVRLRRLSTDAEEGSSRWSEFAVEDFQLVSGALLQVALIVGAGATTMIFDEHSIGRAVLTSAGGWAVAVLIWKFMLALISEDTGEVILRKLLPFARTAYYAFWPILFPLRKLLKLLGRHADNGDEEEEITDDQVQAYIDVGEEEGIIEGSEGKMLQSIVDFGDRLAHEIMTPRIDVLAFDARRSIDELARLFSESKYARIPIYEQSIDQITGIVHVKDILEKILKNEGPAAVAELARPPYFVSETKKVSELLREFQSEHLQIAIVVDEYGGTAGIITTEDIIEEIVGEIADEHEDEEATIVEVGDGTWLVSGLMRVETLEEKLDADLSGDDYETVAGLIFTSLGRVPSTGTVVAKNGWLFQVERADRRRIYRVKVSQDPNWGKEGDDGDEE
jgi:CBS domain containing-hemolysin-like protein